MMRRNFLGGICEYFFKSALLFCCEPDRRER